MSGINCKKMYEELARLKELKVEFDRAYEEGIMKRDFSECGPLYKEMKRLMSGDSEIANLRDFDVVPELMHLKLKEQYETQVEVAWKSGLFEKKEGAESDLPVIERGGVEYPMPSWQEVKEVLRKPENLEIIKEKSAQGFTKMLIVPFGYDLKTMAEKFKEKVRELDQVGLNEDGSSNPNKGIFGAGGEKVEFDRKDRDYPVNIKEHWNEHRIVYYPKQYDHQNHEGMSKEEAINNKGAWHICFVEDMPVIPKGIKKIGGRTQISRNESFIKDQTELPTIAQYKEALDNFLVDSDKKQMRDPEKYRYEEGQIPEQYIWLQLNSLLDNNKSVLIDYEDNEWRSSCFLECYNVDSGIVLSVAWYFFCSQINMGGFFPVVQPQAKDCYVRTAVIIK